MKTFGLLIVIAIIFLVPLLSQWFWQWTMPLMFPGAVAKGLIARTLPYKIPFAYMLVGGVMTFLSGFLSSTAKKPW